MNKSQGVTYKDAGVDIDAGNEFVKRITPFCKETQRPGADGSIGGFGSVFDIKAAGFKDPLIISSTDGVGTKLFIARETGRYDTIGIDLVAMCVNDLIAQGAEPLFFLDYYASGKLSLDVAADVVKGIAAGCKEAGCALSGGETAEMPGMYQNGDFDIAGFSVGAVERTDLLPKLESIFPGDLLIALPSSGIHSNGYSLVRKLVKDHKLSYIAPAPFDSSKTLGEALLTPTKIYAKESRVLRKSKLVKAFAHITGGGITENLPRVLPKNVSAEIQLNSWELPPVFNWLQELGNVSQEEMLKTFNCGIGMICVISSQQWDTAREVLKFENVPYIAIGKLIERSTSPVVYI